MSRRLAVLPASPAILRMTGTRMITTGVLLTSEEARNVPPNSSAIDRRGWRSVRRSAMLASASTTPVRIKAPERMNMAAMVMGAGLAKTCSISLRGR